MSSEHTGRHEVVVPPHERECERCGRVDTWDDDACTWRIVTEGTTDGAAHCIHEWDINGTYNPVSRQDLASR